MRYKLIIVFLIFYLPSLIAQETAIYYLDENKFKEALILLEQKQYLPAREVFRDYLEHENYLNREEYTYWRAKAEYHLAWISMQLQEPEAEKKLLAFTEKHEGTTEARLASFDLGLLYYDNKRYRNAIIWFEKIKEYDLSNEQLIEYNFKLAYSYFILKRFDQAQPLFKQIQNTDSKYTLAANYYYGFIEFYEGRLETALESFDKAEYSVIFEDVIPYFKAQIYYLQGDYEKVISYLQNLLNKEDIQYKLHLHHLAGKAHFELGNYEQAASYLRYYADGSRRINIDDLYQLGMAYYKNNDFENAIEFLEELNHSIDDSLYQFAMYSLGDAYLKADRKESARNAFKMILNVELNADIHQLTLINYAKLSYELNYQKEAYLSIEELIEQYPKSPYLKEAQSLLIDVLYASSNYKEALEILDNMQRLNTDMKRAYQKIAYKQALAYKNDGKTEESLEQLNRSLEYPLDNEITVLAYYLSGELNYLLNDYDKAIDQFLKFLQSGSTTGQNLRMQASYSTAYAYLKMKQYKQAITYLDKSISLYETGSQSLEERIYKDAFVRKGDCHLMSREFTNAIAAYEKVVQNKWNSWDYALFQQGLVEGLKGNSQKKISLLLNLHSQTPNSLYADDALFYAAATQSDIGEVNNAINNFDQVINDYPNSRWVVESYVRKGLLYYNNGNNNASISNFKFVIENYPNSDLAMESMKALKEVYVSMGQAQTYIDYINSVPSINISSGAQDSLLYSEAEEYYYRADCQNAITYFNDYLSKFPKGIFHLRARYYRASCHMKNEEYEKARADYEFIASNPYSEFTENSLLRASELNYYEFNNFEKAYQYYTELEKVANDKENKQLALKGMMRSSYKLDEFDNTIKHADRILGDQSGNRAEIAEANYYLGKIYYSRGKFTVALSHFQAAANFENSSIGAESQFHVARIYYLEDEYNTSLNECFKVKNNYSNYEYWVVKTFILMADNYIKLDNVFQAKATLQSIVDNYEGDKILLDQAKRKLAELQSAEKGEQIIIDEEKDSLWTIPNEK